jgi:hypothetical protein
MSARAAAGEKMRNVKLGVAELLRTVVVCKSDEKCRFDARGAAVQKVVRLPFPFLNVYMQRRKVVIAVICNDFCTLRNADAKWGENDKCLSLFRAKLLEVVGKVAFALQSTFPAARFTTLGAILRTNAPRFLVDALWSA